MLHRDATLTSSCEIGCSLKPKASGKESRSSADMLLPGGHEETTNLPDQAQILVLTRLLHANRYPLRWKRLVPDKPAPAEAATVVSAASTKTAVPAAANKTAPEVNLGRRYTILPAQLT